MSFWQRLFGRKSSRPTTSVSSSSAAPTPMSEEEIQQAAPTPMSKEEIRQVVKAMETELQALGSRAPLPIHALQFVPNSPMSPAVQWLYQIGYSEDKEISQKRIKDADQWIRQRLTASGLAVSGPMDYVSDPGGRRYLNWTLKL